MSAEGTRPAVLVVDDSEAFGRSMRRALRGEYEVSLATSASAAREALRAGPDAVLLDLRLDEATPERLEGIELLEEIRRNLPGCAILVITGYGDVETAVQCMRLGAADFLEKGGDVRALKLRIARSLEASSQARRLGQLERDIQLVEPREIVGESAVILEVKTLSAGVGRDGRITALVVGETGTGKELVARAIHATGWRAEKPFVAVAIPALPASTLEAELFGYEPGAFTDAQRRHLGLLERARGGVLFLDEIAVLGLQSQVKLLRFLEERTFARLGGTEEIRIDVQVVAATNRDLGELVRKGEFRDDLYYRLRVCEIRIPALRERAEDIPALAQYFLSRLRAQGRVATALEEGVMEVLRAYLWPGNVRELRNALDSASLRAGLAGRARIDRGDLPAETRQ